VRSNESGNASKGKHVASILYVLDTSYVVRLTYSNVEYREVERWACEVGLRCNNDRDTVGGELVR